MVRTCPTTRSRPSSGVSRITTKSTTASESARPTRSSLSTAGARITRTSRDEGRTTKGLYVRTASSFAVRQLHPRPQRLRARRSDSSRVDSAVGGPLVLPGFDLQELIIAFGYVFVFGIVFAESGLLIGFFLPGDSLLFTAGFLASQPKIGLDVWVLAIGSFIAAVAGDSVGYSIGYRVGRRLFNREDSLFFHKKHLLKAEAFYEKHGGKAIVLARFMPIVRTFAPIVAGMGSMKYSRFLFYNIFGGLLWGSGVTVAGYYFGKLLPPDEVDKYLLPVIFLIIVVSVLPSAIHVWRESREDIVLWLWRRLAGSRA
ncbi:MAG: VTT domain-containing protein [Chloroflexi bacterium]|nr:VTT domain-containing protein [Chloroflexota bacterium]